MGGGPAANSATDFPGALSTDTPVTPEGCVPKPDATLSGVFSPPRTTSASFGKKPATELPASVAAAPTVDVPSASPPSSAATRTAAAAVLCAPTASVASAAIVPAAVSAPASIPQSTAAAISVSPAEAGLAKAISVVKYPCVKSLATEAAAATAFMSPAVGTKFGLLGHSSGSFGPQKPWFA